MTVTTSKQDGHYVLQTTVIYMYVSVYCAKHNQTFRTYLAFEILLHNWNSDAIVHNTISVTCVFWKCNEIFRFVLYVGIFLHY